MSTNLGILHRGPWVATPTGPHRWAITCSALPGWEHEVTCDTEEAWALLRLAQQEAQAPE